MKRRVKEREKLEQYFEMHGYIKSMAGSYKGTEEDSMFAVGMFEYCGKEIEMRENINTDEYDCYMYDEGIHVGYSFLEEWLEPIEKENEVKTEYILVSYCNDTTDFFESKEGLIAELLERLEGDSCANIVNLFEDCNYELYTGRGNLIPVENISSKIVITISEEL